MSNIEIKHPTDEDIQFVAENLRVPDKIEFAASTGRSPERVFKRSCKASDILYCAYVDGTPVAVFGLTHLTGRSAPWFMGTDALEGTKVAKAMLVEGRKFFKQWASRYGVLSNHAHSENELHLKYIRALGCELLDPKPHGALRFPFTQFIYYP